MAEITTKVLVLGGGPGGYVAAIRAGQHGLDTVLVERAAEAARRHLPKRRLHPVEGADPRRRGLSTTRGGRRRVRAFRPQGRAPVARLRAHDRLEGRHRRPAEQRRRRAAEAEPRQDRAGPRDDARRQDLPRRDRHRPARRSAPSTSSSRPAPSRRPCPSLPFGGRVISSTEALSLAGGARAPGGGRGRLHRARARHRLTPSSAPR